MGRSHGVRSQSKFEGLHIIRENNIYTQRFFFQTYVFFGISGQTLTVGMMQGGHGPQRGWNVPRRPQFGPNSTFEQLSLGIPPATSSPAAGVHPRPGYLPHFSFYGSDPLANLRGFLLRPPPPPPPPPPGVLEPANPPPSGVPESANHPASPSPPPPVTHQTPAADGNCSTSSARLSLADRLKLLPLANVTLKANDPLWLGENRSKFHLNKCARPMTGLVCVAIQ